MGLNNTLINEALEAVADEITHVAIGDGPLSTDEVSAARVAITWDPASGAVLAADTSPTLDFTGTPSSPATHALFFDALTSGTFKGSKALSGDQAFNAAGEYSITTLTVTGSSPT